MLVCNVSLRPQRSAIAADLAEAAVAGDLVTVGIGLAALLDEPVSANDTLSAFVGQVLVEAASASDTTNAGLILGAMVNEPAAAVDSSEATYAGGIAVDVVEAASAADDMSATVTGIVAADVVETASAAATQDGTVIGSPITWDAATATAVTLSGGDLIATNTGTTSTNQGARVADVEGQTTGKYYIEITSTVGGAGNRRALGIGTTASTYVNMSNTAVTGNMMFHGSGNIWANGGNSGSSIGILNVGDVVGIAADLDNRTIWFRKAPSGNWNGSGTANPATNTGGIAIPAGTMVPFCTFGGTGGTAGVSVTANFGASAFTGAVPSGFTSGWQ